MFGVKVISGEIKMNAIIKATKNDMQVILGKIIGMQLKNKPIEMAKKNDEVNAHS